MLFLNNESCLLANCDSTSPTRTAGFVARVSVKYIFLWEHVVSLPASQIRTGCTNAQALYEIPHRKLRGEGMLKGHASTSLYSSLCK